MSINLEKVVKDKVKPMIEEATQKFLGVTITELNKDISDKLIKNPLIPFTINTTLTFKTSKRLFKKEYITKLIKTRYGNISLVAKILGMNRRSIHRAIKELDIDVDECRKHMFKPDYYRKELVGSIVRGTLDSYKQVIHPIKLEKMYENVTALSEGILKELPDQPLILKEAEREFERQFLKVALEENNNNLIITSKKIKLRYETLLRKLKKLGIR